MKKRNLLLLLIAFQFIISISEAQTTPFPAGKTYAFGLMASNRNSEDANNAYNIWKTNFVEACSNGRYRVRFDNASQTVSEGIGYGMLLAAYKGDRTLFDGLWNYYKDNRNNHGVMHWKINGCSGIAGQNGATDSEVDAAMALIVASAQWGSSGAINYTADAKTLIGAIKSFEVEPGTLVLKPGDYFGGSSLTNPSYLAPGYFRAFGTFTNDASFWNGVAAKSYSIINGNLSKNNAKGGLVSDWSTGDGSYSSAAGGYYSGGQRYHYDAARTPWRIAVDYVWYGTADAKSYSQKSSDFVRVTLGGTKNIKDGYFQNGSAYGAYHNSTFVGGFASAAMGGGDQNHLNSSYADLVSINDNNSYFNQTLKTLYLFLQTGNFYLPGASTPPVTSTNKAPVVSLTAPANYAAFTSPASITISANATDSDGSVSKVEFFNGATKLGEDLTSPFSYSWNGVGAGTYSISAKATDNSGATASSSAVTVTVSNTPVVVTQSPYQSVISIPGRVEAENYDLGGSGVAYNDASAANQGNSYRSDAVDIEATTDLGGGFNIGYISAGEWLEYSVNVNTSGKYNLSARVASAGGSSRSFHIEMNGVNVSGSIAVPLTGGWQTWQTVTIPAVSLSAGSQIMRIVFNSDNINLNYIEFNVSAGTPSNLPPSIALTSPSANGSYVSPANINISAAASDNDGYVSKVEFYNGTTKLGEDITSPYTYAWNGVIAGTYSISAKAFDNSGAITNSTAITISVNSVTQPPVTDNCNLSAVPSSAAWVLRNDWADQNNGSVLTNTASALKITHRQWGSAYLWAIETGRTIDVVSGRTYTISMDYQDDAVNKVASIEFAFSKGAEWNGANLSQPSVTLPSGYSSQAFTTKVISLTAQSTGKVYLAYKLNWSAQPNATVNAYIKNVSVCESASARMAFNPVTEESPVSVSPHPFMEESQVLVKSDKNSALEILVTDLSGKPVYHSKNHYTNELIRFGREIPSGNFILHANYEGKTVIYKLKKN